MGCSQISLEENRKGKKGQTATNNYPSTDVSKRGFKGFYMTASEKHLSRRVGTEFISEERSGIVKSTVDKIYR